MEGGALPAWQAFAMNGTWFLDQFGKFSHPQVDSTSTHYPKDFPWLAVGMDGILAKFLQLATIVTFRSLKIQKGQGFWGFFSQQRRDVWSRHFSSQSGGTMASLE